MRGRLLLPEEGAARHGVDIRPVARLSHVLVAGVETSNKTNLIERESYISSAYSRVDS